MSRLIAAGQRFFDDFREVHGHAPETYAIYGYEAMSLVLDAIDRAADDGEVAFDHVIEPVVVEPTTGPEITDPPDPPR